MIRSHTPARRVSHVFRGDQPITSARGLTLVRTALTRWGLDEAGEPGMDAVLVAGELLANARRHAGGIAAVGVSWLGDRLRISVSDTNFQAPRLTWPHDPARAHGHGLFLVERVCTRWGAFRCHDGKTVWAELRCPPNGYARPSGGPRLEAPRTWEATLGDGPT